MTSNIYDEKKKFNIIDALIIFLIIALILVVIFRAQLISLFNDAGKRTNVEISFVCEEIPSELLSSIALGNTFTWLEADAELGTLNKAENQKAAIEYYYDDNNALRFKEIIGKKSFDGKINGTAINNKGCHIDGTDFLASGMTITLTNGKVQFEALITSVVFQ